jgi:hypothetical protein
VRAEIKNRRSQPDAERSGAPLSHCSDPESGAR